MEGLKPINAESITWRLNLLHWCIIQVHRNAEIQHEIRMMNKKLTFYYKVALETPLKSPAVSPTAHRASICIESHL